MERVFFIPVVVEVCGCRHLGLVANPPELLISSASSRLIHPPPAGSRAALLSEMHRSVFSDLPALCVQVWGASASLDVSVLQSRIHETQASHPKSLRSLTTKCFACVAQTSHNSVSTSSRYHSSRPSSERVNYVWVQTFGDSCLRLGDEVFFSTDPVNGCEANV